MTGVFAVLGVILLLAFLIESLVEYLFGAIAEHVPALKPYEWLLMYVAMAVGILGAWIYQFDLISLCSRLLDVFLPPTVFGVIISGMAIGRGSNFIHEIVSKWFKKPDATG
jgi:hypothetical protein